jgi:hypothetical protein
MQSVSHSLILILTTLTHPFYRIHRITAVIPSPRQSLDLAWCRMSFSCFAGIYCSQQAKHISLLAIPFEADPFESPLRTPSLCPSHSLTSPRVIATRLPPGSNKNSFTTAAEQLKLD